MITYSSLGNNGRLGNQMFQYAMLLGVQDKLAYPIVMSKKQINADIFKCFEIEGCHFIDERDILTNKYFKEKQFSFDESIFSIEDGTDFHGYFQSQKYFEHCINKIRKAFTFKQEIEDRASDYIFPYIHNKLVSIHVRRGDYLHSEKYHPLCTMDYYTKAMAHFDDAFFIVFSDDIAWCKENFKMNNVAFCDTCNDHVDLCVMTMCDNYILANSSYSWWGAWLNSYYKKEVVAPTTWFGSAYSHYDTKDLYLNDFIIL